MPSKSKEMRKKTKKRGEERKGKVKVNLEILLSAHARTSQADIFASGSEGCEVYDR